MTRRSGEFALSPLQGRIGHPDFIAYGERLRERHGRSDHNPEISDGRLAWDDQKPTKRRLYQCRWDNSKPEAELRTIDFVSAMTDCFPFLIGITAE